MSTYQPDGSTLWTLMPDWREGILERLMWKTDVLSSDIGVEQRRRLRIAPRVQVEVKFTLFRESRRLFDSLMNRKGNSLWRIPMWWDRRKTSFAMAAGQNNLAFDYGWSELVPGSVVMLSNGHPFTYELNVIEWMGGSTVWCVNQFQNSWPNSTRVYGTRLARIIGDPEITQKSDDVSLVTVTFQVAEAVPPVFIPLLRSPLGYPIIHYQPDYSEDVTQTYVRLYQQLDNQTGVITRRDMSGQAFRLQQVAWTAKGREGYARAKSFLQVMFGRLVPVWLPSFMNDLDFAPFNIPAGYGYSYGFYMGGTKEGAPTNATDSHINITRCGYTEMDGPNCPGRRTLMFTMQDGTVFFRNVVSAGILNAYQEVIQLDAPLGREVTSENLKRISFMRLARQDQDDVEIVHLTDVEGVAKIKTTFRSTEETRMYDPYDTSITWTGNYTPSTDAPAIPNTQLPPPAPTPTPSVDTPTNPVGTNPAGGEATPAPPVPQPGEPGYQSPYLDGDGNVVWGPPPVPVGPQPGEPGYQSPYLDGNGNVTWGGTPGPQSPTPEMTVDEYNQYQNDIYNAGLNSGGN